MFTFFVYFTHLVQPCGLIRTNVLALPFKPILNQNNFCFLHICSISSSQFKNCVYFSLPIGVTFVSLSLSKHVIIELTQLTNDVITFISVTKKFSSRNPQKPVLGIFSQFDYFLSLWLR